jgi:hypothetical protein
MRLPPAKSGGHFNVLSSSGSLPMLAAMVQATLSAELGKAPARTTLYRRALSQRPLGKAMLLDPTEFPVVPMRRLAPRYIQQDDTTWIECRVIKLLSLCYSRWASLASWCSS